MTPSAGAGGELVAKPRLGHAQLAIHGRRRDADGFRRLVVAQAAEEVQLDDGRLARVEGRQPLEDVVQVQDVDRRRG